MQDQPSVDASSVLITSAAAIRPLFLTAEELRGLTGLKRASTQASWLAERGYKFERRVDGSVAMLMAELEARLIGKPSAAKPRWRQDLSTLDKAG